MRFTATLSFCILGVKCIIHFSFFFTEPPLQNNLNALLIYIETEIFQTEN